MKHQTYLCVDVHTSMQNDQLVEGEGRMGMLTMIRDGELFEFDEMVPAKQHRNLKLWSGHRLNVKLNAMGELHVHFRRLELSDNLNPQKVSTEIYQELRSAMAELGM